MGKNHGAGQRRKLIRFVSIEQKPNSRYRHVDQDNEILLKLQKKKIVEILNAKPSAQR